MTAARPQVEIERPGQEAPEPELSWEGKEGNTRYRIVTIYNTVGSPPHVVLEKLCGEASLGEELWNKVELPKDFPTCIIRALAGK